MAYGRDGGSCATIGGYVIGDPRLPGLRGRYVYTDYCSDELRSLVRTSAAPPAPSSTRSG
jgi:hypothetical protein